MGKSIIGKFIYYWIFILGGVFAAKIFTGITEPKEYIILLVILTLVYWGVAFLRGSREK